MTEHESNRNQQSNESGALEKTKDFPKAVEGCNDFGDLAVELMQIREGFNLMLNNFRSVVADGLHKYGPGYGCRMPDPMD